MPNTIKTIMIVDDDPLILMMCREALEAEGYTVRVARNGVRALDELRKAPADAVFLDIIMPEKDGIETLMEIKNIWPRMPVYMISGGGRTRTGIFLDASQKFGAEGLLKKPFRPFDMIEMLRKKAAANGEQPEPVIG